MVLTLSLVTLSGNFLKNLISENIHKAYGLVEQMNPSHYYAKATLLDPRYKKVAFVISSNADRALQEVQYEVAESLRNISKSN